MPLVFTKEEPNEKGNYPVRLIHHKPEKLPQEKRDQGLEFSEKDLEKPDVDSNAKAKATVTPDGDLEWEITYTPDVEGFMDAVDEALDRKTTRTLLRDYPDMQSAFQRERWERAWSALDDAVEEGALTDDELDTIKGLADDYAIPKE